MPTRGALRFAAYAASAAIHWDATMALYNAARAVNDIFQETLWQWRRIKHSLAVAEG